MQKIEAVIQPSKLDAVKDALVEIGVEGMTITEARGHGRQKGHTEFYRGREYSVDLLPKIKLELVTSDDRAELAIQAIITAARGQIDGHIGFTPDHGQTDPDGAQPTAPSLSAKQFQRTQPPRRTTAPAR